MNTHDTHPGMKTPVFYTWNSCRGLETFARGTFATLAEAQAYTTPQGGPNRITCSDGRQWTLGAYADRSPEWFPTDAGPRYVQTLRAGLRRALFESASCPNALTEEEGEEIAARHGLTLADVRPDFAQANEYGQGAPIGPRAFPGAPDGEREQLQATHEGRFHSARFLFEGYCYESARVSYCESQEAIRNEDRAYGYDD